jgi:phosphoribosylglycinamide formyltransferase-1
MRDKLRLALFISGKGTTAMAIMAACKAKTLQATPAFLVMSSREGIDCGHYALNNGMSPKDLLVCDRKQFPSEEAFGKTLLAGCLQRGIDVIGQYGWIPKTPRNLVDAYQGRMVNQHPGPLDPGRPDFGGKGMYGMRVHCARLLFVRTTQRDFWTEATAQLVAPEYDAGGIIGIRRIDIKDDDTPESLRARVLPEEHKLHISMIHAFREGTATERPRHTPVILPGDETILQNAKTTAKLLYPKG